MLVMQTTLGQIAEGLTGREPGLQHIKKLHASANARRIETDRERAAAAVP